MKNEINCFIIAYLYDLNTERDARSEIDYKGITKDELSFKKGDVLYVVNSCAMKQYTTKWKARILGADGEVEEGLIPKLR